MQTTIKMKIKIEVLDEEGQQKILEMPPAQPELTVENAGGRYVYVPPSTFDGFNHI